MSETPGVIGGRDHFNDFDLDSPEFRDHYGEVLDELLDKCPVAHSKESGGYWIVSRADDVRRCALDYNTFTTTQGFEPNRSNEEGGLKLIPLEIAQLFFDAIRTSLELKPGVASSIHLVRNMPSPIPSSPRLR